MLYSRRYNTRKLHNLARGAMAKGLFSHGACCAGNSLLKDLGMLDQTTAVNPRTLRRNQIREGEAISKIETKSDLPLSLSARLRIVPVIAADALGSPLPSFSRSLPPKRAGSMGKTGGKIRSRAGGTVQVSVRQGLRKVGKRAPNDATKTPTAISLGRGVIF